MLKYIFFFYFILNHCYSEEYFLTLRNDNVNLRLGPSFEYPVKIIYKKKYLPVVIKEKFENFRKIQDHEKNSGWVHISQLSKKKAVLALNDMVLFKSSTIYSKPIAKIQKGRLLIVSKCHKKWCKIKTGNYTGWVEKINIWGKI